MDYLWQCPVSWAVWTNEGYFQTINWLWAKPWDETISLQPLVLDQQSCETCEPVSMELRHAPVVEFQNLIVRSAEPPPVAKRSRCHGHQARALTAAWCSARVNLGVESLISQMFTKLSLPCEWETNERITSRSKLTAIGRPLEAANLLRMSIERWHERVSHSHVIVVNGSASIATGENKLVPGKSSNSTVLAVTKRVHQSLAFDVPQLNNSRSKADGKMSSFASPRNRSDIVTFVLSVHQVAGRTSWGIESKNATSQTNSHNIRCTPVDQIEIIIVTKVWSI